MDFVSRIEPAFQFVREEADIAKLIRGDRVKVVINHEANPAWMAYGGHEPEELNASTICRFIEIPENYAGDDVSSLNVWESYAKHLHFPKDYIEFDSLHRHHKSVELGTVEYQLIKPLLDILIYPVSKRVNFNKKITSSK